MPVTTTDIYGSRTYESIVLSHSPTAVFGPYNNSSGIIDLTNHNYISASIASTSSYSDQIPFFALADKNYSFDIKSSSKIVIKELVPGAGFFAIGDESRSFSVEFLMSKNFDVQSNPNFAKFGLDNSNANVSISYDQTTNQYLLDIYNISGSHVYRSYVFGGLRESSNHFVLNFSRGRPDFYLNGQQATEILNSINTKTFNSKRAVGRVVAEFGCSDNSQNLLISMISFYPYALSDQMIKNHYAALYDVQSMKDVVTKTGGALLHQTIQSNQKIARNDDRSQDFFGTDILNTYVNPDIMIRKTPNFTPYFSGYSFNGEILQSGSSVDQGIGFSFLSTDYGQDIVDNETEITFRGVGSGAFNSETPLIYISDTSVGDIHVSIDSASSKLFIGSSSTTKLAYMSSSVARGVSYIVNLSFSGSTVKVQFSDGSASMSYTFDEEIQTNNSNVYLFNRYYQNELNDIVTVGNSLLNFNETYLSSKYSAYVRMSNPYLTSSGSPAWNYYQYKYGNAMIDIPVPEKEYNYLSLRDSGTASYTLYTDSGSHSMMQSSSVFIPSSSSHVYLSVELDAYWGGNNKSSINYSKVETISLSNYTAASYSSMGYPATVVSSSGLLNSEVYPSIFRRYSNGFLQTGSNTLALSPTDESSSGIGQLDFLISIPPTLSSSNQTLFNYNNSASMKLAYNSTSNVYILSFGGMTASINSVSSNSGVTRLSPRQIYFVQIELTSAVPYGSVAYLFSEPNGTSPFAHWFDKVSVFEPSAGYRNSRYGQVFGRKSIRISDNDNNYIKLQSVPDDFDLINKTWQTYYS